ncbi:MAG: glycoside hydrolase family 127 protein [Calditrichaeota bacterium]|nr:glycoside hydrolase family 127 protein [Calditrichota bacterium]
MRRTVFLLNLVLLLLCSCSTENGYPIQNIPFNAVKMTDEFWSKRIETDRLVTIPHAFHQWDLSGIIDNFAIAAGLKKGEQSGVYTFEDSDVFKTIEAAAYSLAIHPDPKLESYCDSIIQLIAGAQENDGYLYTVRTNQSKRHLGAMGKERWSNLSFSHELYNMGHLYEAAAAYYLHTGKRDLLDVALKNVKLIQSVFGPGKLESPPGHQEIELGLVSLYRITKDKSLLDLAIFFLDQRGRHEKGRKNWGSYSQDHKPIVDQSEIEGHAVRAGYMNAALIDVTAESGDQRFRKAIDRLWENMTGKKMYLTGGIGSVGSGERFGDNYSLPNMTAYSETCSSISNMMWNQRLFQLTGEAKYVDILERVMYNAFLAGVSMDGNKFYYDNPLASRGQHLRREKFVCSCCIGNVARTMTRIPGYIYATGDQSIYVNLYASNQAKIKLGEQEIELIQRSEFPWNGTVQLTVNPISNADFTLFLRVPGWARSEAVPSDLYHFSDDVMLSFSVQLNGEVIRSDINEHGYIAIDRNWKAGDQLSVNFLMPIRQIKANPNVFADTNRIAFQRGPFVYAIEGADQKDGHVLNLRVPEENVLTAEFKPDLLNGLTTITGSADAVSYRRENKSLNTQSQSFTAIPYYAWTHRGRNEMAIWLPTNINLTQALNAPSIAERSHLSASVDLKLDAIRDGKLPRNSADFKTTHVRFATTADTVWLQYDFNNFEEVSEVKVYWLKNGSTALPKSWKLLAKVDDSWTRVWNPDEIWPIETDKISQVYFETIKTNSIRLEIIKEKNSAVALADWEIY